MRTLFSFILALLTAISIRDPAASGPAPAPGPGYVAVADLSVPGVPAVAGDEILFDVRRNGKRVGFHRVRFDRATDGLIVNSLFQIEISFLGLTVYRYRYDSRAVWKGGDLEFIRATVDDDGATSEVQGRRVADRFLIQAGDDAYDTAAPVFPTNHWNPGVLGQGRVLNTLTGRINDVRIEAQGQEPVATEQGEVFATRYAYTGDLETEVWYDVDGRWVKMRFKGRDGSTLEYECRRCLIGGTAS